MDSKVFQSVGVGVDRAALADMLTLSRLLSVPLAVWVTATRSLNTAMILVGLAWCSDYFDGRLARSAERKTRLSQWDLRADLWLAAGLGAGMGMAGYFSWWVIVPLAGFVFLGPLFLTNPSPMMVGLACLYTMFLWTLVSRGGWWWLPALYLLVLLAADWDRFRGVIMPALWRSLSALIPGERFRPKSMVLDDWVHRSD